MRSFVTFFALLAFCAFVCATAVHADPPSLSVPPQVAGGAGAFLSVPAATSGKTVRWFVLDSGLNLFPPSLLKDTRTAVVCSVKPGTYRLVALTAAADEISEPAVCTIVIQGDAPGPSPPPNPPTPPSPGPKPTEKAAWAIVVVDNNARTPAVGRLLGAPSLFSSLKASGVTMRVLDVSDSLIQEKGYSDAVAAAGGAPALLVYTAKGRRLNAVHLPADEAAMLAAIGIAQVQMMRQICGPNGCILVPEGK